MTISASTIISAVNALTMTPSRALLILRDAEGGTGGMLSRPAQPGVAEGATVGRESMAHQRHERRHEALPWWIFGLLGGWLTFSYGPSLLPIADCRLQIADFSGKSAICNLQSAIYFIPGAGRRGLGLVHHSPGERGARLGFSRLQSPL